MDNQFQCKKQIMSLMEMIAMAGGVAGKVHRAILRKRKVQPKMCDGIAEIEVRDTTGRSA